MTTRYRVLSIPVPLERCICSRSPDPLQPKWRILLRADGCGKTVAAARKAEVRRCATSMSDCAQKRSLVGIGRATSARVRRGRCSGTKSFLRSLRATTHIRDPVRGLAWPRNEIRSKIQFLQHAEARSFVKPGVTNVNVFRRENPVRQYHRVDSQTASSTSTGKAASGRPL